MTITSLSLPRLFWVVLLLSTSTRADSSGFNYAEALQKSLYFYEAQQSGSLSPNNRVEWRGAACLTDGQDLGMDLSGGWFDAGDHWTANLTMSFAAMTLAWAAVEHPEGYLQTGQMEELLESLIHVNRYFLKCVLHPETANPAKDLEVVIGCGGREGVESPSVHSMWGPAEVAHLMTQRPTFRLNHQCPGGDIPAAMAAAMGASSMVIREHAGVLKGKRGYADFDGVQFADLLVDRAGKLTLFARAHAGPVLEDKLPQAEKDQIQKARSQALRSDGKVVETGYRAAPFDKLVAAASWMQRAEQAKNPKCDRKWFEIACEVYEKEYKAESNHDWWKDYGAGNFAKLAAFNLMRLAPDDERFHADLQLYCCRFGEYSKTPGGLRLREAYAHEYGSLRHANNAAVIALYYSEHVEKSPPLKGNTWWKGAKSNAELRQLYFAEAKRQVDYALGANPYGRSYLVGFGQQPFNHPHHRGAYGAWAGFEHFIPGKADDRGTNRHILYGALIAGPDHNDVFLGVSRRKWLPVPGTTKEDFFYQFPNRKEVVQKEGYVWDSKDEPYQEVMDSQFNEVALDYNAGFTASLAMLCARGMSAGKALAENSFPPKEVHNNSLDLLTTDREFFVSAKEIEATSKNLRIEATLWNRSRWPAKVRKNLSFRYYFTLDGATRVGEVTAEVSGVQNARITVHRGREAGVAYAEVAFPAEALYPGGLQHCKRTALVSLSAAEWESTNDWSHAGMSREVRLIPKLPVYEENHRLGGEEPE
jgi:endoglucanase